MIVDTHCHVSDVWYEPADVLLRQMDAHEVERAWLVQLLGSYDNGYQHKCCAQHPDRFASIVGVDWTRPGGVEDLKRLADDGVLGMRLRPGSRSPGDDPLAIWRAAADARLIVSCVGTAAQFAEPAFADLVDSFPDLRVVLEHLGGLARPDVGDIVEATPRIAGLATHANLSLKVPGLGQMLPRAALAEPQDRPPPPLAAMLASFGADRLMWGSDFPVVSTREGYGNALNWARTALPGEARTAILGGSAEAAARPDDRGRSRSRATMAESR